jgi:hypothetical protein
LQVAKKLSAEDLYDQFQDSLKTFHSDSWRILVFEGSPAGGLYSWCPDCVVMSTYLKKFESSNPNSKKVKILKFKVGSRREWESKGKLNPFKTRFPYLSDVPTAILFFGKLDVMRTIAPRDSDFQYMLERARIYEQQVKSGDWHPPVSAVP